MLQGAASSNAFYLLRVLEILLCLCMLGKNGGKLGEMGTQGEIGGQEGDAVSCHSLILHLAQILPMFYPCLHSRQPPPPQVARKTSAYPPPFFFILSVLQMVHLFDALDSLPR